MNTPGTLQEQLETLKGLNRSRFDYVLARAQSQDVSEALKKIGLSRSWFYKFNEAERSQLEELAEQLHRTQALKAFYILEQAAGDAAVIKVEGLKSRDKRLQQATATEILDRVLGKAFQPITGKDGGPIESSSTIEVKAVDYRLAIAPLAPGSMGDSATFSQSQNFVDGKTVG